MARGNIAKISGLLNGNCEAEEKFELLRKFNEFMNGLSTNESLLQNGFPRIENRSRHEKQLRNFSKPAAKRRKAPYEKGAKIVPILDQLVTECVGRAVNEVCWQHMLAADVSKVMKVIEGLEKHEAEEFYATWQEAKVFWSCFSCDSFDISLTESGFVECLSCSHSYHKQCVQFLGEVEWLCLFCESD